jgi:hypothetical protein
MSKRPVSQLTAPDGGHSRPSLISVEPKLSDLDLDQTLRPPTPFSFSNRVMRRVRDIRGIADGQ